MARPGKVWWNRGKGAWYSTIAGKKTKIADGDKSREQAEEIWHQFHAKEMAVDLKSCNPVRVVFVMFMEWRAARHPASMVSYRQFLQSFLDFHRPLSVGEYVRNELRVRDLTAAEVHRWLYGHPEWCDGTKCLAMTILQAALNWAAKPERKLIDANPIAGMAKPRPRSRGEEALIAKEQEDALCAAAHPAMRNVIFALRQTGTRPSNIRRVTARDVNLERGCIVLHKHKTVQKTGRPVVIPVTPALAPLLRELCARHRAGPIFRTQRGRPWTENHLSLAFRRLREKIGLPDTVTLYGFRHTTATDLLLAGVPDAKVAAILNHKDTKMLYHHYGHLAAHIQTLTDDLDAAINGSIGTGQGAGRPDSLADAPPADPAAGESSAPAVPSAP